MFSEKHVACNISKHYLCMQLHRIHYTSNNLAWNSDQYVPIWKYDRVINVVSAEIIGTAFSQWETGNWTDAMRTTIDHNELNAYSKLSRLGILVLRNYYLLKRCEVQYYVTYE